MINIDRHHCSKSGNIPKGGQIHPNLWQSYDLQEDFTNTRRGHVGAKVFYREDALAYPQIQLPDVVEKQLMRAGMLHTKNPIRALVSTWHNSKLEHRRQNILNWDKLACVQF